MSVNIIWNEPTCVNNEPYFEDLGFDARNIHPGIFGSQYPRMVRLNNLCWMIVYTVYRNNGYISCKNGGTELAVAVSCDSGASWEEIAVISDPGRDLDNGQMIITNEDEILLACRSVIWQQSYKLPVYISKDGGYTWSLRSIIDENHEGPGVLGNPDRGVYEPHFLKIDDNSIGVMYASEKYACTKPSYSQIIVEKVTSDNGVTWSDEIWAVYDIQREDARPGMPVWDKMGDGTFILAYEIIGSEAGDVFYKKSKDGVNWEQGLGKRIPEQKGGAYILVTENDLLLVTSNTHNVSISSDYGKTWVLNSSSPWKTLWKDMQDNGTTCTIENGNLWPAMYRVNSKKIIYVTSVGRSTGGNSIQYRIGELQYD